MQNHQMTLGAICDDDDRCHFRVWAPNVDQVRVKIFEPQEQVINMQRNHQGYHQVVLNDVREGALYMYQLEQGVERPDPASRLQPHGVHGPSQVTSLRFDWSDKDWAGIPLQDYIFYEIHIGTFTPEGTFEAVIPHLDRLKSLGVTAIEIMPVAEFPGARGWGYDGVNIFAPHHAYGGPQGLKLLIDACHQHGLAVVLDVVYNHFGPEGNYLNDFGPYFTDRYHTPWGAALNFDGPQSDHVRRYFIENALYWITEFHVDALRLDATHAMLDFSAYTFLEELADRVHLQGLAINRRVYIIAENDRSDDRLLRRKEEGGYGIDAQWSDDLHHALHTLLTGEDFGYYHDYGAFSQLSRAMKNGFVYAGHYSPFRERKHGSFRTNLPAKRFVVCSQNHDQIGNRMNGDRLGQLVSFDELKLAASVVLLSPYLPLIFMGEEYAETAPFLYFTSFQDPEMGKAVSIGRKNEFKDHKWEGEIPDPQDESTFLRTKLNQDLCREGQHQVLHAYYTKLIELRKSLPALRQLDKDNLNVTGYDREHVLYMHRWQAENEVICVFNFNRLPITVSLPVPQGKWNLVLYSADAQWLPEPSRASSTPIFDWDETSPVNLTLVPKTVAVFVKA